MLNTVPPETGKKPTRAIIMCGRKLQSGRNVIAVKIGDDYLSLTEDNELSLVEGSEIEMRAMKGFLVTNYWNKKRTERGPLTASQINEYTNGITRVELSDNFTKDEYKPSNERGYPNDTTPLRRREALVVGRRLLLCSK